MAFQINAEVVLRGPTNLQQTVQQIKSQIGTITGNINIQLNQNAVNSINQLNSSINQLNSTIQGLNTAFATTAQAAQVMGSAVQQSATQLQTLSTSSRAALSNLSNFESIARRTGDAMFYFGEQTGLAVRRFAAFSVGAGAMLTALYSIKQGIAEAVTFDREMVRLAQVGSNTASEIRLVSSEIGRLATTFGTSSRELAQASVTIRQAGFSATETARALETLAQASLSPNFGDMNQNATAAIAVMAQFKLKVDDLNRSFSSINAVAAEFPVSAKDITDAIIRAGGSFAAIGGNLNEFISLFTSVKSVTQESSESIATGLRNIFTRIQTRDTLDRLREMQINLRYTADEARALGSINLTGQFVKPLEAIQRIQTALRGLSENDQRYINILQAIGGTRQIGRALPLVREQGAQQRALDIANNAGGNLSRTAEIGMESLSVRTTQVFEKFQEFFRLVVNSDGFRILADQLLRVANAFAEVLKFAAPIVPVLAVISATKIASGVGSFISGFTTKIGAQNIQTYQPYNSFANGGYAPGGPSFLMPGERVIAPQFAGGGSIKKAPAGNWTVPGVGNSDTELYDLPRNSFVIRKDSSKKIGLASGGFPNAYAGYDFSNRTVNSIIKDFSEYSGVDLANLVPQKNIKIMDDLPSGSYASYSPQMNNIYLNKDTIGGIMGGKGLLIKSLLHEFGHAADYTRNYETMFSGYNPIQSQSLGDFSALHKLLSKVQIKPEMLPVMLPGMGYNQEQLEKINYLRQPDELFAEGFVQSLGVKPIRLVQDKHADNLGRYIKTNIHPLLPRFAGGGMQQGYMSPEVADLYSKLISQASESIKGGKTKAAGAFSGNLGSVELSASMAKNYKSSIDDANDLLKSLGVKSKLFDTDFGEGSIANYFGLMQQNDPGSFSRNIINTGRKRKSGGQVYNGELYNTLKQALLFASQAGVEPPQAALKEKLGQLEGFLAPTMDVQLARIRNKPADVISEVLDLTRQQGIKGTKLIESLQGKFGLAPSTAKSYIRKAKKIRGERATELLFSAGKLDWSINPEDYPEMFAMGGMSKRDTVPALLTPGEYVFSPEAVNRVGLANLDRMNRGGSLSHMTPSMLGAVRGYAKGGYVKAYAEGDTYDVGPPILPNKAEDQLQKIAKGFRKLSDFLGGSDIANVVTSLTNLDKSFETFKTKAIRLPKTPNAGVTNDQDFDNVLDQLAISGAISSGGSFRTRPVTAREGFGTTRTAAATRRELLGSNRLNYNRRGAFGLSDPSAIAEMAASGALGETYDFEKIPYVTNPFAAGMHGGMFGISANQPGIEDKRIDILNRIKNPFIDGRLPWYNQSIGYGGFSNSPRPVVPGFGGFSGYVPPGAGYGGFSNFNAVLPPNGFGGFSRYTNSSPPSGPPNIGYGGFSSYAQTIGYGGFSNYVTPPQYPTFRGFPPISGGTGLPPFMNGGNFGNGAPLFAQPNPFSNVPGLRLPNVLTSTEYNSDRDSYNKMLADFYKKRVNVENKGLSQAEKDLLVQQKQGQIRGEMFALDAAERQTRQAQYEVNKFSSRISRGQSLTQQEEQEFLNAQNRLNAGLTERQKRAASLTYTKQGGEFSEIGNDKLDGGGFFGRLFGRGTKFQAFAERAQAAAFGLSLVGSLAGDAFSKNAGTSDEAIRNSSQSSFIAGRAISTGSIGAAFGAQLGSLAGPYGTIAGGIGGAVIGGGIGIADANKELKLSAFAIEIEHSVNSIRHLTEAIDRLGGRISNEEIGRLGGLTENALNQASLSYSNERYGSVLNAIPPIGVGILTQGGRFLSHYDEELRQGQGLLLGANRAVSRINPFVSNESLADTDSTRQQFTRLQNIGNRNPALLSSINRQIEGIITNALAGPNGTQLSNEAIRTRITSSVSSQNLNLFAANRGFEGSDRVSKLLGSEYFSSIRSSRQNQLILSGVSNPIDQVIYGMTRFNKELTQAAHNLGEFASSANVFTSIFSGGSQLGNVSSLVPILQNPLKSSTYFGAVESATAGLGAAGSVFSGPANLAGRISSLAPDLLRRYLGNPNNSINAGDNRNIFNETLRTALGGNLNPRDSNFVEHFSQQLLAKLQGNKESFQNPNVAEQEIQKILADTLQPLVDLTRQRERIAQNIINVEQQVLNLTLRRAETLGRIADTDFELLRIREQQKNLRETGVATNPLLTGITYAQFNQPFNTRINALGQRIGVNENTPIGNIQSIITGARAAYEATSNQKGLGIEERQVALNGFNNKIIYATRILEQYANSTQRAAYFQEQLGRNQAERSNRIDLQKRFLLGGNEERLDLLIGNNVGQHILGQGNNEAQQRAFEQLGDPARQAFIRFAESAGNIRTGGANNETFQVLINRLIQGTIPGDIIQPLNTEQQTNERALAEIYQQASQAATALAQIQDAQIGFLQNGLLENNTQRLAELNESIRSLTVRISNPPAGPLPSSTPQGVMGPPMPNGTGESPGLWQRFRNFIGFSRGGAARGTDTIPAMLSPNEFVVNSRSAMANRELLEHINNMNGPAYLAGGGPIVDRSNEGILNHIQEGVLWPFRGLGNSLFGLRRQPRIINQPTLPGTGGSNPYTAVPQAPPSNPYTPVVPPPSNPYEPLPQNPYESIGDDNNNPFEPFGPGALGNRPRVRDINPDGPPPLQTGEPPVSVSRPLSIYAGWSPITFESLTQDYGAGAAAAYYQYGANANLLRQQLLSQTHTTGLFGSRYGGGLGLAQRQQQAAIFGSQAQANRRYLGQQPSFNTENQLLRYLGPRRYATGGYVDNIPAMLSEGEFVFNQAATRNIGPANLARMQHFAAGGLVGNADQSINTSIDGSGELMAALNNFSNNNRELVEALSAFPHTIEGSFTHNHNVNITGLSAFENIEDRMKELMQGIAEEMITDMIKSKLPDLDRTQLGAA